MHPEIIKMLRTATIWSVIAIILHLPYLNTVFLNFEYLFNEAGRYLSNPESSPIGLTMYFRQQANPLGYSFILSVVDKIIPLNFAYWPARIPSLLSIFILLYSLAFSVSKSKHFKGGFHLLCALTIFTPMIWTFSGRATADLLPHTFFYLAMAIALNSKGKYSWLIISALIFSLSIVIKYNNAILGLGFLYICYQLNNRKLDNHLFKKCSIYFLIPGISLGTYVLAKYNILGIFLYTKENKSTVGIELLSFPSTFTQYSIYLIMMLATMPLIPVIQAYKEKNRLKSLLPSFLVGSLIFTLPFLIEQKGGEMNYGPLDPILSGYLELIFKFSGAVLFTFLMRSLLKTIPKSKDPFLIAAIFSFAPYFLVCSLTRPAQRYLIPLLPLIFYFLIYYHEKSVKKFVFPISISTLALFIFLNIFTSIYQYRNGESILKIINSSKELGVIQDTFPGAIAPHADNYFWKYRDKKPKKYSITYIVSPGQKVLSHETVSLFGKKFKEYFLVENKN